MTTTGCPIEDFSLTLFLIPLVTELKMKRLLISRLIILLLLIPAFVQAQQQLNLPLLSNWDDNSIPPAWTGPYSECWGYANNGREYAFLASTQGTYFFDITVPETPLLIDFIRTK